MRVPRGLRNAGLVSSMGRTLAARARRLGVIPYEVIHRTSFLNVGISLPHLQGPCGSTDKTLPRVKEVEKKAGRRLSGDGGGSPGN